MTVLRAAAAPRARRLVLRLALSLALTGPVAAQTAAPPAPEVDRSGKGAVLCARSLAIHMREVAAFCHPEAAKTYVATVDWALQQYDRFIMDNSSTTAEALARDRADYVRARFPPSATRASVCRQGNLDSGRDYFAGLTAADYEKMKASVRDQLSVPRKPLMNPCM